LLLLLEEPLEEDVMPLPFMMLLLLLPLALLVAMPSPRAHFWARGMSTTSSS
jgi:hypothetical protein